MHKKDHPKSILSSLRQIKPIDMLNEKGLPSWPKIFFIESYHSEVVEEHHVHLNYASERWKRWLDDKKVWVPNKQVMDISNIETL